MSNNNLKLYFLGKKPTYQIIPSQPKVQLFVQHDPNKTIVSVLDHSYGFGDFLRGSITLAQYAKKYNLKLKLNLSKHNIQSYLQKVQEVIPEKEKIHEMKFGIQKDRDLAEIIKQFIFTAESHIYIESNMFYDTNLVTPDIKEWINSQLVFKQHYYDKVKELVPFIKYQVVHIRCKDEVFNNYFTDGDFFYKIKELGLNTSTIVISSNNSLKRQINSLFGFYYLDIPVSHTATTKNVNELESTVLDYIILSKSSSTYCFSYYGHGSGFSEQCSILHDIPYKMTLMC